MKNELRPIGFTREQTHQQKVELLAARFAKAGRENLMELSRLALVEYEDKMPWHEGFPFTLVWTDAWKLQIQWLQAQKRIDQGAELASMLEGAP